MEEENVFLRDYPALKPFVLSGVVKNNTLIGQGYYGTVNEVIVPLGAAAKSIHSFLDETSSSKPAQSFLRECKLLRSLRHRNIVQFFGLTFFPGNEMPSLVMEKLLMSLHDFLDPEPSGLSLLSLFTLALRISVLQDVACGLNYLHERIPPIIHRDLSARNVLLSSELVAKIADLGGARIAPRMVRMRAEAAMTKGPGSPVYMPPEASTADRKDATKSKYGVSIDIFSFGVITIFTIGGVFPCDPLHPSYHDESGTLIARTELQRRANYMRFVVDTLRASGEDLQGSHPLIRLIQQCLHNRPSQRPVIREVLNLLDEAGASYLDQNIEKNREEIMKAIQKQNKTQQTEKNLEQVMGHLVKENTHLQCSVQRLHSQKISKLKVEKKEEHSSIGKDVAEAQSQLRKKDEELMKLEAEVQSAEQKIAQNEQLIKEMKQQEAILEEARAEARKEFIHKEERVTSAEALVKELRFRIQEKDQELQILTEKMKLRVSFKKGN